MLNVAPQKERIPDHLRAMAEQDDKSAASGKTGEQSSIGVGCAPGEERDSAISICAVHSTTVTAAIAEYCEDTVEKQKTLTDVLDGLVELTTRLASLATARRSAIVAGVVVTATENLGKARTQLGGTRFTQSQFVGQFTTAISAALAPLGRDRHSRGKAACLAHPPHTAGADGVASSIASRMPALVSS